MKTASVADLRNQFRRVSSWIEDGETVQILKQGKPFARLVPNQSPRKRRPKPDVMARLDKIWGNRTFSAKEVAAMRAAELEGEEG
jgi:antitoxin (DNA-binding transcriptional repressor) of toxin-antitoxin stability system